MTGPGPDFGPTGSRLVLTGYLESKYIIYILVFIKIQVKNTINAQDTSNDVSWAFFCCSCHPSSSPVVVVDHY